MKTILEGIKLAAISFTKNFKPLTNAKSNLFYARH